MKCRSVFFVATALLATTIAARAGYVPMPMAITKAIEQSEVIVVATVTAYKADPAPPPFPLQFLNEPAPQPRLLTAERMADMVAMQEPGKYQVKIVQTIKGVCELEVEIHLPMVSAFYYGRNMFDVRTPQTVLLLLKKDGDNRWAPVEPLMPFIPLTKDVVPVATAKGATKVPDTMEVLLAASSDVAVRSTLTYILRGVEDKRVGEKMAAYADDEQLPVRANALYCLAVNQDVTAIPKIAKLIPMLGHDHRAESPVGGLSLYKTPKAIPFLNPLVAEGDDFVRLNAISALAPMADKSSIPYLLQALEKDDGQKMVSYFAYCALYKLAGPEVGTVQGRDYFLAHRAEEVAKLKSWWAKVAANTPA